MHMDVAMDDAGLHHVVGVTEVHVLDIGRIAAF
jgi:hypothetical protein